MDMKEWARQEIDIACKRERGNAPESEWDYGCACYQSAYKAFLSLLEDGHSGMSISFTRSILNYLIAGKPLTPIEDTPDIWNEVPYYGEDGAINFQCNRMSSLFKYVYPDGRIRYSDVRRIECVDRDHPNGARFHNGFIFNLINDMFPIEMPYCPDIKPFLVYRSDFLFDPKNGDYDTMAIWYVEKPDGSKVEINRFFKESGNTFEEITREEYDMRAAEAEKRKTNET